MKYGPITWPGAVRYAEVALTNAEIKALRATPKTLVAAPGTGKILEFLGAMAFLDYGTNVLTESGCNLTVKYTDGSGAALSVAVEATGFIDATADTMAVVLPIATAPVIAATACANKAIVLHNVGGGEIAGNAAADTVIRVKVYYMIHNTGF